MSAIGLTKARAALTRECQCASLDERANAGDPDADGPHMASAKEYRESTGHWPSCPTLRTSTQEPSIPAEGPGTRAEVEPTAGVPDGSRPGAPSSEGPARETPSDALEDHARMIAYLIDLDDPSVPDEDADQSIGWELRGSGDEQTEEEIPLHYSDIRAALRALRSPASAVPEPAEGCPRCGSRDVECEKCANRWTLQGAPEPASVPQGQEEEREKYESLDQIKRVFSGVFDRMERGDDEDRAALIWALSSTWCMGCGKPHGECDDKDGCHCGVASETITAAWCPKCETIDMTTVKRAASPETGGAQEEPGGRSQYGRDLAARGFIRVNDPRTHRGPQQPGEE